jgi:DNA mismatch repair protein MutS
MLDQYRRIKREHQGEVLFFRLGDFYEMFADDAREISALLNLTLTSRNGLPMCGIPYHAARAYIARLLKLGKKIAICEQLSEPTKGRGVIDRQVVEVITPGTTVDDDYLDTGSANYLAALAAVAQNLSFAYIDLSTGDFYATAFPFDGGLERLRQEFERLQIKELILQESLLEEYAGLAEAVSGRSGMVVNRWADWLFDRGRGRERLEQQFSVSNLRGFGLEDQSPEILSAGALLDYLDTTARSLIPHVRTLNVYGDREYLGIDEASQRNLELVRNLRDGEMRYSLLEVMDETKTAMGRRLLKRRILHPLRDPDFIGRRLDMVEALYRDQEGLSELRELLVKTPDLERLSSRLAMDRAHGKDMALVKNALAAFRNIEDLKRRYPISFEAASAAALDDAGLSRLALLRDLLQKSLTDDPSILLTEGNLIREGYDPRLDNLRRIRDGGRKLLEKYLETERKATGIPSLKIRYNRMIGYFFEVTKAHLSKVPAHFIRRQGIISGERYTTDRLAALESKINGASDQVIEMERKLFMDIREQAKDHILELTAASRRIAELDVAQSLARAATIRGWVRPALDTRRRLIIREGRHPVVEAYLPRGGFIPNDVYLDEERVSFALITGPNMAGKSTYLRQAALTVIMAQAGSFVPAREATVGIVDRIYCRVGASDNLARGESTFLMEMNETAYILHTATEKSLVIMDEVGRGTGTDDGLSIAWAVSEDLLDRVKCRTLFATHYHELSRISHPHLANRSMEVLNKNGEIVFLRKLKEGPSSESYGLHVARLAGLPEDVLSRAFRIMERLRKNEEDLGKPPETAPAVPPPEPSMTPPPEPPLAAQPAAPAPEIPARDERFSRVLEDLRSLDPDRLTPLEALKRVHNWKKIVGGSGPVRRSRPRETSDEPLLFDSS